MSTPTPFTSLTQTTISNVVTTTGTLPHSYSPTSILSVLHTPHLYFNMNPYLTTFTQLTGNTTTGEGDYEAIEVTPISTLAVFKTSIKVNMKVRVTLTEQGFVADIVASGLGGLGTKCRSETIVIPIGEGEGGGCKVEERFTLMEMPWGWSGYVLRTAGKGNLGKFGRLGKKIEEFMASNGVSSAG